MALIPRKLWPLLQEHSLVACVANEGWMIIRRTNHFDLFVEDQPYNSVEVLFHPATVVSTLAYDIYKQNL